MLNIVKYTALSIAVYGDGTKPNSKFLKEMGGLYKPKLKAVEDFAGGPGWIFPSTKKEAIQEFIDQVNSSGLSTFQTIPNDEEVGDSLNEIPSMPIVPTSAKDKFQVIKWKVFRPEKDMVAKIVTGNDVVVGQIVETTALKDVVVAAKMVYTKDNRPTGTQLVVVMGKWQVWGYNKDHRIEFSFELR